MRNLDEIRRRVTDSEYGENWDEIKATYVGSFTDSMAVISTAKRRLVIVLLIECGLIGLLFLFPERFSFLAKLSVYVTVLIEFWLGFVFAFAVATIVLTRVVSFDDLPSDGGPMSGYAESVRRTTKYKIWFIASAGGVLNVILFYVLLATWARVYFENID